MQSIFDTPAGAISFGFGDSDAASINIIAKDLTLALRLTSI